MKAATCRALLELNRAFYANFAGDFAATRRGWPLGFTRILPYLRPAANVLDVGCGNGRFLAFLRSQGWAGSYVGVDSSAGLLAEAEALALPDARFVLADLMAPDWDIRGIEAVRQPPSGTANLLASARNRPKPLAQNSEQPSSGQGRPLPQASATDAIVCLAVLHHIPGRANRVRFLAQCRRLLAADGRLILSTWQFMTSPRLRKRVLPWAVAGISEDEVEPGDHLVAWGQGAAGHRYCAFIPEAELVALAGEAGLAPVALFAADGHEGNLNLYGVFNAR